MKGTVFSPHEEIFIQHLKVNKKHNMSVQHYHDGYEIYFQLIIKAVEYTKGNIVVTGKKIEPGIIKAIKYIGEHYTENISLDDISQNVHISKFYFCRRFRVTTGATVLEYLNNVRLTKVHNLLLNTQMSIDEIASKTGFSSAINLTRTFKKVYGNSPRDFRKLNRQK